MAPRMFKRARCCEACGSELLRTDGGSICADSQCSASPIASPLPPPELERLRQLRTAGYVPASPIRPAMPTLQAPTPAEAPPPPPRKSAAQREQEIADDIRWAQARLKRLGAVSDDARWAQGHLQLLHRGKNASGEPGGRRG